MALRVAYLRVERRRRFVGQMPGKIFTLDRETEIFCRPLDVSRLGFSIYTEDRVELDNDLLLLVGDYVIELQRVYSIVCPGLKDGYRHGFKLKDQSIDLERICAKLGYL